MFSCHVCHKDIGARMDGYTVFALVSNEHVLSNAPPVSGAESVRRGVCRDCYDKHVWRTGPAATRRTPPSPRGKCIMCGVDARSTLGKSCLWDDGPRHEYEHDHLIKARMCHECYEEHVDEEGRP